MGSKFLHELTFLYHGSHTNQRMPVVLILVILLLASYTTVWAVISVFLNFKKTISRKPMSVSTCTYNCPQGNDFTHLKPLQVSSEKVGLYGRRVVTFELATRRRGASTQFPSNSITPGRVCGTRLHVAVIS